MKEQIEQRLEELRSEFEAGQTWLADSETRQAQVRNSLLRISGAIQVLEELLNQESMLEQSVETAAAI
ncbi:MAG: hypothetical protein ACJ74G_08830 [Blastocatellia bacterium]|jgi:predicted nuclease with TOPRIM domain